MTQQVNGVLDPLSGVPLLGDLVSLLDQTAAQLGLPFWLRSFAELVLVGIGSYFALRLVVTRLLPWLGTVLVAPVVMLAEFVRVLLLLPDLAVSRAARRLGRIPPELVYAYGTVIMTALDGVQQLARRGLPTLAIARKVHRLVLVTLLLVFFLIWNTQSCTPGTGRACVAPVTQWTTSLTAWFSDQTKKHPGG